MKLVVANPKTGKTYQKELTETQEKALYGSKINDVIKGDVVGLPGYELQITGGSDKQGFPMRKDLHGTARKKILLSGGPGFHPTKKGERRRKSVRGNTISEEIAQVNTKVIKEGKEPLEKLFGKEGEKGGESKESEESKGEEKPKETKKEDKPEEKPKKETPKEKGGEAKPEEKSEKGEKK